MVNLDLKKSIEPITKGNDGININQYKDAVTLFHIIHELVVGMLMMVSKP